MKNVIFFLGSWAFTIALSVAIDQSLGKYIPEETRTEEYLRRSSSI